MDFVLALHSHLPYVLRHGRWPHGSDWLCEAAVDTYLPLIEKVHELASRGVPAPLTLSVSPVLANQLADPFFGSELDAFFAQRLASCDEARRSLPATGDGALLPLVDFWEARFRRLQARFEAEGRNIAAAFARQEAAGHLEVTTCAATHGYLPLLARDESVRLQLAVAVAEHRRLFGRDPAGCWLPECAYRPRGWWEPLPGAPNAGPRAGIEEHLAAAGIRYSSRTRTWRTPGARSAATRGCPSARSVSTPSGAIRLATAATARGARPTAPIWWERTEPHPG